MKKKIIAITQRVYVDPVTQERRDCLDQRWFDFAQEAGFILLPLPNNKKVVTDYLNQFNINGFIFSGGNDLHKYGGNSPERDLTERLILKFAISEKKKLIGVCRGMQIIGDYFGNKLVNVSNHVTSKQVIHWNDKPFNTNSYHNWGFLKIKSEELMVTAIHHPDCVIKAFKHHVLPIYGVMWHPERNKKFDQNDISFFRNVFKIK